MPKFEFWLPTPDTLTRKQRRAIDSHNDIFLTGVPGSGKTVVSIFRLKKKNNGILFTYGKLLRKTIEEKVNDNTKDTPLTVTLKAYAKEDPERVQVLRKAVFIYPRADKLK